MFRQRSEVAYLHKAAKFALSGSSRSCVAGMVYLLTFDMWAVGDLHVGIEYVRSAEMTASKLLDKNMRANKFEDSI